MYATSISRMMLWARVMLVSLALVPALVVGGCKSGVKPAGMKAAGQVQTAAKELSNTESRVNSAVSTLDALVNHTEGDLRPKFDAFNKAVNNLGSSAEAVEKRATAMAKRGQEYFKTWEEEVAKINNEDIKELSAARKDEVQQQLLELSDAYQLAKAAFVPFFTDLKDLRTALTTDLTPAGLAATKPLAMRASENGRALQSTISKLMKEFQDLGMRMSPTMPAR